MKKIASLLVLFSIYLSPVCKGEKLKEEFFKYKKEWKNDQKKKMKQHRVEVDDNYFEFMLPKDMIKTKYAKEKYSGEKRESIFSFASRHDKYNQFYMIKCPYKNFINDNNDTCAIKEFIKSNFYNHYCLNYRIPYTARFVTKTRMLGDYPSCEIIDIFTKYNHGFIRDTIQTNCSKTIATDSTLYVFIYDTDDHIYEVPLEEKLAVMKSIRIISKEEAKAEEEKNTAGNMKFLISMLALLFLVFIGSKLNNRR